jgi:hypothetical protein
MQLWQGIIMTKKVVRIRVVCSCSTYIEAPLCLVSLPTTYYHLLLFQSSFSEAEFQHSMCARIYLS